MLAGLFATVVALAWVHHHHALAQLVGAAAGGVAFIGGAGGPSFSGPPRTFLFDTWQPTSGAAVVNGTSLTINATQTSAQAFSMQSCTIAGVDCATAFGSSQSDPLTQAHWTSTTGSFTATADGGMLTATGSASSGTGAWGDSFTRANGVLVGTFPETPYLPGFNGGLFASYTESASDFTITSNSARASGTGSSILYADTGASSGTLSVTLPALFSGSGPGLVFRTNSTLSQFLLLEWFGGTFYLEHCTTSPITCSADATAAGALAAGDTLSVVYAGNSVTGKKNGSTVVAATITQYPTNTGAGILNYSDPAATNHYTNFGLAGDSRRMVLEGETATTPWYIALGAIGRGPSLPGILLGGPANSGAVEIVPAVVLDSSLAVTRTIVGASTVQGTQFISTIATGTAPATAASTTKVTNWNADLLDGLDSTVFYKSGDSPAFNVITTNTIDVTVQLGLADHPRGVCNGAREGDINYDAGHFYGCNGSAWLQLDN